MDSPHRSTSLPTPLAGRFDDVAFVGQGATGSVYAGTERATGDQVAIKLLRHAPEVWPPRRWRQLSRLRHPALLPPSEVGQASDGTHFVVRPFASGVPASELAGSLSASGLAWLSHRIADLVMHLHRAELLHGDIKPDNLIVRDPDQPDVRTATLIDFGFLTGGAGVPSSGARGTLAYMAPELFKTGRPTPRTDLYALAATLFELDTGEPLVDPLGHDVVPTIVERALSERMRALSPAIRPAVEYGLQLSEETPSVEGFIERLPPMEREPFVAEHFAPRDELVRELAEWVDSGKESRPIGCRTVFLDGPPGSGRRTLLRFVRDELALGRMHERMAYVADRPDGHWLTFATRSLFGSGTDEGALFETWEDRALWEARQLSAVSVQGDVVLLISQDGWTPRDDQALSILVNEANGTTNARVSIVVACGGGVPEQAEAFWDDATRFKVPKLSDDEIQLVLRRQQPEMVRADIEAVADACGGNGDVLRQLVSLVALGQAVPKGRTVEQLCDLALTRRWDALGEHAQRIFVAMELLGGEATVDELRTLPRPMPALRELTRAGFVRPVSGSSEQFRCAGDIADFADFEFSTASGQALVDIARSRLRKNSTVESLVTLARVETRVGALSDATHAALLERADTATSASTFVRVLETLLASDGRLRPVQARTLLCRLPRFVGHVENVAAARKIAEALAAAALRRAPGEQSTDGTTRVELSRLVSFARLGIESPTRSDIDALGGWDALSGIDLALAIEGVAAGAEREDRGGDAEFLGAMFKQASLSLHRTDEKLALARSAEAVAKLLSHAGDVREIYTASRDLWEQLPTVPATIERPILALRVARVAVRIGRPGDARRLLDEARMEVARYGWLDLQVRLLHLSAELASNRAEWGRAERELIDCARRLAAYGDWSNYSAVIVQIAGIYQSLGAWTEGVETVDSLADRLPEDVKADFAVRVDFARLRLVARSQFGEATEAALSAFADEYADTSSFDFVENFVKAWRCESLWRSQRVNEMAAIAGELAGVEHASRGEYFAMIGEIYLARAALTDRRFADARALVARAGSREGGDFDTEIQIRSLRAQLAYAEKDWVEAESAVREAMRLVSHQLEHVPERFVAAFRGRWEVAEIHDLERKILSRGAGDATLERVAKIIEIARSLMAHTSRPFREVLSDVLEQMVEFAGAEKGALVLVSEHPEEAEKFSFRTEVTYPSDGESINVSNTVLRSVAMSGTNVLSADALADHRFDQSESVHSLEVRSILAFPLVADRLHAIVYMDHREKNEMFAPQQVQLLELLAEQLAVVVRHARTVSAARDAAAAFPGIIGQSEAIRSVLVDARKAVDVDIPVLITGETGTGKDLLARRVHDLGPRRDAPFVNVNCSAIASTVFEAEMFGSAKGAFTGAITREGYVGAADGGTLFLNEIGLLSKDMQGKLLDFLQSGQYFRVGESKKRHADVRLLAATNEDLGERVQEGAFRKDLYYRLRFLNLHLPPLRERPGDVPLLADYFLAMARERHNVATPAPSPRVVNFLSNLSWPGNIRELERLIHVAVFYSEGRPLTVERLESLLDSGTKELAQDITSFSFSFGSEPLDELVNRFKRWLVTQAIERSDGNRSAAAKLLRIHRRTIYKILSD